MVFVIYQTYALLMWKKMNKFMINKANKGFRTWKKCIKHLCITFLSDTQTCRRLFMRNIQRPDYDFSLKPLCVQKIQV